MVAAGSWGWEDAEACLASREPFGWRFGLERMRRLVSALGMPQHRFASIHVVGTNGKSSVARMAVALLGERGMRAGAYLSPHLERWTERVLVGGADIEPAALAAALERAEQAARAVDRTLPEDDAVTQFELLTAAAFVALAAAGVEVAAIEAGLGGRLDATNVLPSRVSVLTSVSPEHTELLGESEEEIATEKLAVLRDHTTLVLGEVPDRVRELAERVAAERSAAIVRPGGRGEFPRRNLALARAAAEAVAGPLPEEVVRRAAEGVELPGVLELRGGEPPLVLDAAHNPAGARALAGAVGGITGGRPVVGCVAILGGKDAASFARELSPAVREAVCTEVPAERLEGVGRPGSSCLAAADLACAFTEAGVPASAEPDPRLALELARRRARELGGAVLACGTHYLLPYGS